MGTLQVPQQAALLLAVLLAVSFAATAWKKVEAAAPPPVVVGCVKCLDCSPNDVNAFKDLQVAIKCKSGAADDESYEMRALGTLDDTGVFRIPLAAELLRDDGSMDRDCFAQLHSSLGTPCVGQAPPRIAPTTSQSDGGSATSDTTYLAAAADTVFAPVACACGKKKKHYMFGPPPPPPRPTPTPTPNPPTTPTYGPPTPTPTPVPPEPRPPAPEEPEPFFKKKPKMKFMHKKKPCPPLVDDDDTTRPAAAAEQGQEKLPKKLN